MFPDSLRWPLADWVNDFVEWLVVVHGDTFGAIADGLLVVLVALEGALRGLPWWATTAILALIAYHASRRIGLVVGLVLAMVLIGSFGLWDMAMQTLSLMIVGCVLSVSLGVPAGIAMSRSARGRAIVLPVLDAMQTLPSFVYLVPALMLFGLGKVPAIVATVIYAVPPVVRLTDLGIRQVDAEVVEASVAFGASGRQRLFGVELPLALPSIMAGINQTVMMALSMVVLASMIGARGLGEQVLLGIQRLDVGRGMEAGIAIVALAIVVDRITQAYGGGAKDRVPRRAG
jgi:glycine betaine/proline transport system permease protein